jgi:hypothetical protein
MKHVWTEHQKCTRIACMICDGGLALCSVCGLLEGALTTDCCGKKVSYDTQDLIYKGGNLDFREGYGWVNEPNPTHQIWNSSKLSSCQITGEG